MGGWFRARRIAAAASRASRSLADVRTISTRRASASVRAAASAAEKSAMVAADMVGILHCGVEVRGRAHADGVSVGEFRANPWGERTKEIAGVRLRPREGSAPVRAELAARNAGVSQKR